MYRPVIVTFLLSFASLSIAKNTDWNCQQNTAGTWNCLNDESATNSTIPATTLKSAANIPANTLNVIETADEPKATIKTPVTQILAPAIITPPNAIQTSAEQEGWHCNPNTESSTWDCALVGNTEKKLAVADTINSNSNTWHLLDMAFNSQQERIFKRLEQQFPQNPWQMQCDSRAATTTNMPKIDTNLRSQSPLNIHSDYSEVFDNELTQFIGNVQMSRADQHLSADNAHFNLKSNLLDTQGNVYYKEAGLALFSNSASLKLSQQQSVLRKVLFIAGEGAIRGSADIAYWDSNTLSHYQTAAYTSCKPGNQDWIIHAERLKMNKNSGQGTATNAWLEFKGIPLFYTPYINFPIDNRRITGFLAPSFGTTDEGGFDISTPFYWNLAPDYDLTLRPRYLTKRGGILGVDFRYLSQMSTGAIKLEYMPEDYIRDEDRFHGVLQHTTIFSPAWQANLDLNYVSDDDYFDELGNAISISDRRHVRSHADLSYQTENIEFLTRLENYQTIDRTIASADLPYQKLPQIQLNLRHVFEDLPIDLGMQNEFVYFYRSDRIRGQRLNLKPYVAFPYNTSSSFITPKLALQYTQYFLENRSIGSTDSLSRVLPIASLDTGLFLEREFQLADTALLNTIEPRVYYLYTPYSNQDALPIFDGSLNDFNFNSLFRENRFSGSDRIQDTNQLTLALSTRLINANSGMEYLKLAVGEIFYFENRRVTLPGDKVETRSLSNLIGELSGRFNQNWSFANSIQWDPDSNDVSRGYAYVQYANQAEQIINLGYRYRKDELTQSDISFRWPLYDNWYAVGRWQYSLRANQTKESFFGIEKESCCWRFRIIGRKYINSISEGEIAESESQTGVFVQLELKGLTSIGQNVEEFLERNISGYEKP